MSAQVPVEHGYEHGLARGVRRLGHNARVAKGCAEINVPRPLFPPFQATPISLLSCLFPHRRTAAQETLKNDGLSCLYVTPRIKGDKIPIDEERPIDEIKEPALPVDADAIEFIQKK